MPLEFPYLTPKALLAPAPREESLISNAATEIKLPAYAKNDNADYFTELNRLCEVFCRLTPNPDFQETYRALAYRLTDPADLLEKPGYNTYLGRQEPAYFDGILRDLHAISLFLSTADLKPETKNELLRSLADGAAVCAEGLPAHFRGIYHRTKPPEQSLDQCLENIRFGCFESIFERFFKDFSFDKETMVHVRDRCMQLMSGQGFALPARSISTDVYNADCNELMRYSADFAKAYTPSSIVEALVHRITALIAEKTSAKNLEFKNNSLVYHFEFMTDLESWLDKFGLRIGFADIFELNGDGQNCKLNPERLAARLRILLTTKPENALFTPHSLMICPLGENVAYLSLDRLRDSFVLDQNGDYLGSLFKGRFYEASLLGYLFGGESPKLRLQNFEQLEDFISILPVADRILLLKIISQQLPNLVNSDKQFEQLLLQLPSENPCITILKPVESKHGTDHVFVYQGSIPDALAPALRPYLYVARTVKNFDHYILAANWWSLEKSKRELLDLAPLFINTILDLARLFHEVNNLLVDQIQRRLILVRLRPKFAGLITSIEDLKSAARLLSDAEPKEFLIPLAAHLATIIRTDPNLATQLRPENRAAFFASFRFHPPIIIETFPQLTAENVAAALADINSPAAEALCATIRATLPPPELSPEPDEFSAEAVAAIQAAVLAIMTAPQLALNVKQEMIKGMLNPLPEEIAAILWPEDLNRSAAAAPTKRGPGLFTEGTEPEAKRPCLSGVNQTPPSQSAPGCSPP